MKTLRYIVAFCLLLSAALTAQEGGSPEVFTIVEQQPEYPGGISAMMKFLSTNVKYPGVCKENLISGKVFLKFIVDTDGSVKSAQVIKSSGCELLDSEALRVIQTMPLWTPGKQNGKDVKVYFNIPINFKISDNSPNLQLKQTGTSSIYKEACTLLFDGKTKAAMEKFASAHSDYNCWFVLAVLQYNRGDKTNAKANFIKTLNAITDKTDIYYDLTDRYLKVYF